MPKIYFLDTCILYAAVNENDKYHYKVKSFLEKTMKQESQLLVSQYVLLEYILLSKLKAAREYFEKNPEQLTLPKEENDKVVEKIKESLFALDVLEIKMIKVSHYQKG